MKLSIKKGIITVFFLGVVYLSANAQPPAPIGGSEDTDPGVPLDGGLSFLLAAGAGMGGRKLYKEYKKRN